VRRDRCRGQKPGNPAESAPGAWAEGTNSLRWS